MAEHCKGEIKDQWWSVWLGADGDTAVALLSSCKERMVKWLDRFQRPTSQLDESIFTCQLLRITYLSSSNVLTSTWNCVILMHQQHIHNLFHWSSTSFVNQLFPISLFFFLSLNVWNWFLHTRLAQKPIQLFQSQNNWFFGWKTFEIVSFHGVKISKGAGFGGHLCMWEFSCLKHFYAVQVLLSVIFTLTSYHFIYTISPLFCKPLVYLIISHWKCASEAT